MEFAGFFNGLLNSRVGRMGMVMDLYLHKKYNIKTNTLKSVNAWRVLCGPEFATG